MVKLTEEQKRQLEALDEIPDDQIDFSDIPPITDWSGFKMGLFYRPTWKEFSLKLDEQSLNYLENGLNDGQSLDEAVNRALRAQMYRIRFPIRVQRAEKTILKVQKSPEEIAGLTEFQRQQIEILYGMPVEKVASSQVVLKRGEIELQDHRVIKDVCLELDENVIDWFEYALEDGQSLDGALSKALMDHIHWVSSPRGSQREEEAARKTGNSS